MSLEIDPAAATLGAVVRGVKLAELDARDWRAIEDAFHEHAVLIFPGQHLRRREQAEFGRRFGELDPVSAAGTVPISNVKPDGRLRDDGDAVKQILLGNEGWHTDSSYMPVSARASLLSAEVVTERGGETEWADMRAAWDALDEATRERVAGLAAYHSLKYSQARAGFGSEASSAYSYGLDQAEAPLRPLVKRHPVTGRRSLFIGRHAYGIPGLDPGESETLLDWLLEFACRAPRVLQHRWQPGDLAVWDNRCVLHRARPYDPDVPRVLHHTRIAGDPATESGMRRG
ncbi:MAG TPA: TauD/TfdA family dioxygenase [Myxococcota bacterium]|nr:TauD/TfdA family dioxygenase [Myxococcota bacterium]